MHGEVMNTSENGKRDLQELKEDLLERKETVI